MNFQILAVTAAFVALDVVFGFAQAAKNNAISSTKMRDGLFHKLGFLGAVVLACLCEYAEGIVDLGFSVPLAVPVCAFIILTEVVSILENLGKLAPELAADTFLKYFKNAGND